MDCSPPGSSVHGILVLPGQNTGVGCHALLQGIFPTQGSNQVSCIAGRFFTSWATREDLLNRWQYLMHISWVALQIWKPPPNGRCELLDDQEHIPQGSRSLRTDKVNPCDTTLFPHYYPVRELCTSWIHILRPHSLTRLLKKVLPKPFGALRAF